MTQKIDIAGQRFGRLTAIRYVGSNNRGSAIWLCKCDCGNELKTLSVYLRSGDTTSCGCLRKEIPNRLKHGHRRGSRSTRVYSILQHIIQRCENPQNKRYKDYGGRGITVCERWKGKNRLANFIEDMGLPPPGKSIDRIDNSKGYFKENCRWTTPIVQNNNSRKNVKIWLAGEYVSMSQFCHALNIDYWKFKYLYRRKKLPVESILLSNSCHR